MTRESNAPNSLQVSLSAVQSFRTCQQQYYYRYVERLRRRDRITYLEFGSILHTYLEQYYGALLEGESAFNAHEFAKMKTTAEYDASLRKTAHDLFVIGKQDEAKEFATMLTKAGRIANRYFSTRGETDAERYDVLYVEAEVRTKRRGIVSLGKVDMITRDNDTGDVNIWEHKTTRNIPSTMYRLRDLQTTLYNHQLKRLDFELIAGESIDTVIWNYLLTTEPTVPEQLKNGELTKRANLDSTWEVYAAEIKRLKLDPKDYAEQRQRLEGREAAHYFVRHHQQILAAPGKLLGDYWRSAYDIQAMRDAWAASERAPVRSLSLSCDYCEFADLCNAALLAGTDRDARSRFDVRGGNNATT